ncbi:ER membrane complex subunit 6, variant 2 [Trebouxia sp. C0010 RCD-2024]
MICRHCTQISSIECSRVFASLITGLAAGVLGVTGWGGFAYYFLVHSLLGVPLYLKAQGRPTEFLQSGRSIWVDEVFTSTSLLTFILFWTLTHNFVHLF